MSKKFTLAVLCGGPSPERGISLNSARSVCDHLISDVVDIIPIYFDLEAKAYRLSLDRLYSNTPSDFDFKLSSFTKPLSKAELKKLLQKADLVFPAMHGSFGEDGQIQALLEELDVPFIGSSSASCKACFDKYEANEILRSRGFYALPSIALDRGKGSVRSKIERFFREHRITRAVVKPATGGSSIGVFSVRTAAQAAEVAEKLFADGFYKRLVVEPFCTGTEFTVVILQNSFGLPVSLLPVEIHTDYRKMQIFDFRKKYLPTNQVNYFCPPRFSDDAVERIQVQAEQLFALFGLRDFARFDGWLMPDGNIWFSDFNPVSGMEQNSFLFLQASRVGMSHRDVLSYIVKNAAARHGKSVPADPFERRAPQRERINVLFGGDTAERQVSVMSGTNVWLKLRRSKKYDPRPYLLDLHGDVWELPYSLTLNHTVEEITENCLRAKKNDRRDSALRAHVVKRLGLSPAELSEYSFLPRRIKLSSFVKESPFVFLGLHGGIGEDGTLQAACEKAGVPYNGPDPEASRLCMDKFATGVAVVELDDEHILTAPKVLKKAGSLKRMKARELKKLWQELCENVDGPPVLAKPVGDGCSAGVAVLERFQDLQKYLEFVFSGAPRIPARTLKGQGGIIELSLEQPEGILFETYIVTDRVEVRGKKLLWEERSGWIEITVGVLGKKGEMQALNPSITVAEGSVLSLEEKFQGGTGINITPPPVSFVPARITALAKKRIEKVANHLGLSGYSRIDAFMHIASATLIIIEVNTLPGLTPSTVLFQQALTEKPQLYPRDLLEKIVTLAKE